MESRTEPFSKEAGDEIDERFARRLQQAAKAVQEERQAQKETKRDTDLLMQGTRIRLFAGTVQGVSPTAGRALDHAPDYARQEIAHKLRHAGRAGTFPT